MASAGIACRDVSLGIVDLLVPVILTEFDNRSTPLVDKCVCLTLDGRSHPRFIHFGVKVHNASNLAVDKMVRLNGQLLDTDMTNFVL